MSATASFSERAVRAALDRLRPLAFSATFKLHDMIAEWILRANGVSDWAFAKKTAAYDKLVVANMLREPALLVANPPIARAFSDLYKFLIPFRGSVVHSGGVLLDVAGSIVVSRGGQTLTFTADQQGSYMRSLCLIAKLLTGAIQANDFLLSRVCADLHALAPYHGHTSLPVQSTRLETLKVHVPAAHLTSVTPVAIKLDFDQLRRMMEEAFSVGPSGQLYFSAEIIAHAPSGREYSWQLPLEGIPNGVTLLAEGDPRFDPYLRVSSTP